VEVDVEGHFGLFDPSFSPENIDDLIYDYRVSQSGPGLNFMS